MRDSEASKVRGQEREDGRECTVCKSRGAAIYHQPVQEAVSSCAFKPMLYLLSHLQNGEQIHGFIRTFILQTVGT